MAKFHRLKVKEIVRETPDAVSVHFHLPEDLKDIFSYKHGQYVTVQAHINGVKHRRAYSLCSSPVIGEDLAIGVKRVENGTVSTYINDDLREGDYLELFPPLGKFTIPLDRNQQRNFILIAGGSGITPVFSIIKSILKEEPQSHIYLFYGNRNEKSIIFHQQLDELAQQHRNFTITHIVDEPLESWQGRTGIITKDVVLELLDVCQGVNLEDAEYFVCGPTGMMEQVNSALKHLHVPKEKVHIEYFTSPIPLAEGVGEEEEGPVAEPGADQKEVNKVTVVIYGEEREIELQDGETILEAALREDLDPPYACQMGICTTCKAKCHSGEIFMDEREGLTDEEIEEGYVLTCQSHPKTPGVKVEYE